MIGWLYRMLIGSFYICHHKWEVLTKVFVVDKISGSKYVEYNLQCEKCGDIKRTKLK